MFLCGPQVSLAYPKKSQAHSVHYNESVENPLYYFNSVENTYEGILGLIMPNQYCQAVMNLVFGVIFLVGKCKYL